MRQVKRTGVEALFFATNVCVCQFVVETLFFGTNACVSVYFEMFVPILALTGNIACLGLVLISQLRAKRFWWPSNTSWEPRRVNDWIGDIVLRANPPRPFRIVFPGNPPR